MPIYEYRCPSCKAVFARIRSMSQSSTPAPCPECGHEETERMPSTFAAASTASEATPCPGAPSCGAAGGG